MKKRTQNVFQGLSGSLLLATPHMPDDRFKKSVIFMIAHSKRGAMGLVVNRPIDEVSFAELATQLGFKAKASLSFPAIHSGGPLEPHRGFALHSAEYKNKASIFCSPDITMTNTPDIIRDIAQGKGPKRVFLALGFANWSEGQMEDELREQAWVNIPMQEDLIFGTGAEDKWHKAVASLDFDINRLTFYVGNA